MWQRRLFYGYSYDGDCNLRVIFPAKRVHLKSKFHLLNFENPLAKKVNSSDNKTRCKTLINTLLGAAFMDLDLRLIVVLLPVILAGGWAVYNIGQVAIRQIQAFLSKS